MKRLGVLMLSALLLTGCAPAHDVDDAERQCVRYMIGTEETSPKVANRACEIHLEDLGEEAFIEYWTANL